MELKLRGNDLFADTLIMLLFVEQNAAKYDAKDLASIKRRLRAEHAKDLGTDRISRRAALAQHIAEVQQGGKVALIEDSMDCDCYRSVSGKLYPAAAAILEREIDRIYAYAEGPTSITIDSPDQMPEPYGRDLALEAFEDGHPHVVYM